MMQGPDTEPNLGIWKRRKKIPLQLTCRRRPKHRLCQRLMTRTTLGLWLSDGHGVTA